MFLNYLLGLIQIILSPKRGWEDASYDSYDAEKLFKNGFLPFTVIVGASVFIRAVMHEDFTWITLALQSFVCFLKYFLTYFIAHTIIVYYLPSASDVPYSEKRTTAYLVYTLGILGLINILSNCMPVDMAIIYMLPLYLIIVFWRGTRYMAINYTSKATFTCISVLSIMLPPFLIQILFNLILRSF